jgi:hypothetical protein
MDVTVPTRNSIVRAARKILTIKQIPNISTYIGALATATATANVLLL